MNEIGKLYLFFFLITIFNVNFKYLSDGRFIRINVIDFCFSCFFDFIKCYYIIVNIKTFITYQEKQN